MAEFVNILISHFKSLRVRRISGAASALGNRSRGRGPHADAGHTRLAPVPHPRAGREPVGTPRDAAPRFRLPSTHFFLFCSAHFKNLFYSVCIRYIGISSDSFEGRGADWAMDHPTGSPPFLAYPPPCVWSPRSRISPRRPPRGPAGPGASPPRRGGRPGGGGAWHGIPTPHPPPMQPGGGREEGAEGGA